MSDSEKEVPPSDWLPPGAAPPPADHRRADSSITVLAGGALVVLVVLGVFLYFVVSSGSDGGSTATKPYQHNALDANVACQLAVEEQLRSPTSARFEPGAMGRHLGDSRYLVESYVDAQNSFGAQIRSRFTCEVEFDLQGRRRINKLVIDGENF